MMIKSLLSLFILMVSYAQAADLPQLVIREEESFKSANVNVQGIRAMLDELEYPEKDMPQVFLYDLNGDNRDEILLQSYKSLCGNGGCPYVLIDGMSKRKIGDLFGEPIMVLKKKKGQIYPDIQAFSHTGSGTGSLETYSYRNGKYKSVSLRKLSGKNLTKFIEALNNLPAQKSK